MTVFDAPRSDAGADDGLDDERGSRTVERFGNRSGLEHTQPQWLILKRGEERLALFRGWPEPGLAQTFRQMSMTVGLALEGQDLALRGRFDDCGYVYIGAHQRLGRSFADARRDLSRAGWTVDHDAVWPVIIGGYRPDAIDGQPQQEPEKRDADGLALPTLQRSERMEA